MPITNTITALRQTMETSGHRPGGFRIHEVNPEDYELQFTYGTIGIQPWTTVSLRNGKPKQYKSLTAIFTDIRKLRERHDETLISFVGKSL